MVHLLCLLANVLYGSDDVGVGSAAANVTAHELFHVRVRGAALLFEESGGGHNLARGTVTALIAVVLEEGRLDGMQAARLTKAFDGSDLIPFMHDSQGQTGVNAAPVHMHSASSALAVIASFFCAGQTDCFAQAIEKGRARVDLKVESLAVDSEADGNRPLDRLRGRISRHRGHWRRC